MRRTRITIFREEPYVVASPDHSSAGNLSFFYDSYLETDYPLLIGEVLRRDQHRGIHKASRRAILDDLKRVLGMRVTRDVGTPRIP
jgi:hypothetical protein